MIVASYITHDAGTVYKIVHGEGTFSDHAWEVHSDHAFDDKDRVMKDVKWCATEFEARSVFERLVIEDVTDYWQKKGGMG